jgi:hypothetical protein
LNRPDLELWDHRFFLRRGGGPHNTRFGQADDLFFPAE